MIRFKVILFLFLCATLTEKNSCLRIDADKSIKRGDAEEEAARRDHTAKDRKRRANLTEEELEIKREKDRERQKKYRAKLSEQAKEDIKAKNRDSHQVQRSTISEEQRNTVRGKDALQHKIQRFNLSEDVREENRERNRLSHQIQRLSQSEEVRDDIREQDRLNHEEVRERQTPQQRAEVNATRRSARIALRLNVNTARNDPTLLHPPPPEHYLGSLACACSHCTALYFEGEHPRQADGTYNPCYRNGSITLNVFHNYPPEFEELFTGQHQLSDNFLQNVRHINTSLSVASMDVRKRHFVSIFEPFLQMQNVPGRGPHVFKIHGAVCYKVGPALPNGTTTPVYGQLFFVDESAAADHRIAHPANSNVNPDLLRFLSTYVRTHHEYARSFMTLQAVYAEKEEKARREDREMPDIRLIFESHNVPDPRRYNPSRVAEVALIYVGQDGEVPSPRNFTIYCRGGGLRKIPLIHTMLDPSTYPLYFIRGDFGYNIGRTRTVRTANGNVSEKKITQKDYYCYYLSIRRQFSPIHYGRRLFQQYVVGSWANSEQGRLDFIRNNQTKLRSEFYSDLRDYISDGANGQCGSRILLPASFTSSPRYMQHSYLDAMAIVSRFGKPDIFLTFTANPKWREITENLFPGQTATDRPDLIARVFRLKVQELKRDIIEREVFGKVTAWIYTVEWQKRVDRIIRAELPDVDANPHEMLLFERVCSYPRTAHIHSHMIHRDCGPGSPCWNGTKCSKNFAKEFRDVTDVDQDGYPAYRRRNGGIQARIGSGNNIKYYDNRWIVPFNPELLIKYNCHINVELCSNTHAIKYKYVYKGSDRARLRLRQQHRDANGTVDEVEEYLDARYVCPPEAFHRQFAFETNAKSNPVIDLAVHEENRHTVIFGPGQEADAMNRNRKTTLLAFFEFNAKVNELEPLGRLDELGPIDPRTAHYHRYPEFFTFVEATGVWKPKGAFNRNIGRLHSAVPTQRERYCLRLLLLHTVGSTSYQHLLTVNGVQNATAYEAAKEMGIIRTEDHFNRAMQDADFFKLPSNLRTVFATLLAFDEPQDVEAQWNRWKGPMSDDYVHRGRTPADSEALAYFDIVEMTATLNVRFADFISTAYVCPAPMASSSVDHDSLFREMYPKLNVKQKEAVDAALSGREKLVYLDGPGGSGKTFTYQTIYHKLKSTGKEVVSLAWTGIASNLLPEGRTVASYFKLNIPLNCESSMLKPNSVEGRLMKEVDTIIIDECSMLSDKVLKTIDTVLKDVMDNQALPFGGKTILMGGDFRQVMPIPN